MASRVTPIAQAPSAVRRRQAVARAAGSRAAALLLVVVGILVVIGLGATLSASSVLGLREFGDRLAFFKRQVIWVGLSVALLAITARVPYQWYRRAALPIYLVGVGGLLAVLRFGVVRNGARRWLELGPMSLQPSEFAKFATIVALAAVMAKKRSLIQDFWHFIIPVLSTLGVVGLLVMLEPDLGTTLIIAGAAMAVLLVSEAPLRHVMVTGFAGLGGAIVLAFSEDYRRDRIFSFLDPAGTTLDIGYQLDQSLLALGSGGMLGVGLGASRARWSFLPNAHTDFIFSIIGEEIGFAGSLVILMLFALLSVLGLVVARRAPDPFGRMLAVGITAWLAAQALVNIGGTVGVLPITGLALPFVSAGGSALLAAMGAVGVLVNVARQGRVPTGGGR